MIGSVMNPYIAPFCSRFVETLLFGIIVNACGGKAAIDSAGSLAAVGGASSVGGSGSVVSDGGAGNSDSGATDSGAGCLDSGRRGNSIVWTRTSGPGAVAVAMSSDGSRLVAAVGGYEMTGYLYTSQDFGATWTQTGSQQQWASVASSADGETLVAVSQFISYPVSQDPSTECNSGYIFTSQDSGTTWTPYYALEYAQETWTSAASSADGTKLIVVGEGGDVCNSSDSGATWNESAPQIGSGWNVYGFWKAVASSADGTKLVALESDAVEGGGYIHTSTNSGESWTQSGPMQYWTSVASSSDGQKLAAVAGGATINPGYIYTSANFGATWTQTGTQQNWTSVAMSSDGTKMVAASGNSSNPGYVYISLDSGTTWTQTGNLQSCASVAMSSDGSIIAVACGNGIYIGSS